MSTVGLGNDYREWGTTAGELGITTGEVTNAIMLEIPTAPTLSLGKLQHANITVYDHMPALAIGNSFASPYIPREDNYAFHDNRYGNERIFYDISYHMNEALWDEYYFSSYSRPYDVSSDNYNSTDIEQSFIDAFESGSSAGLPNGRMSLKLASTEDTNSVKAKLFANDGTPLPESTPGNTLDAGYHRAAENLMVAGAFNINSTSIEAWRAVLSGARDAEIFINQSLTAENPTNQTTPILRYAQPTSSEFTGSDIATNDAWTGYRSLSDTQIQELAENIVAEIQARSDAKGTPFLSLSEFVNRKLEDSNYGLAGVIQAAIDATTSINDQYSDGSYQIPTSILDGTDGGVFYGSFPEPTNLQTASSSTATAARTAPVNIIQADILQAIGSYITARGDCFRIRAYGEAIDPESGKTQKAWCEVIVQRLPEPGGENISLDPSDPEYWDHTDGLGNPTPTGRKFQVISFSWLSEDEV